MFFNSLISVTFYLNGHSFNFNFLSILNLRAAGSEKCHSVLTLCKTILLKFLKQYSVRKLDEFCSQSFIEVDDFPLQFGKEVDRGMRTSLCSFEQILGKLHRQCRVSWYDIYLFFASISSMESYSVHLQDFSEKSSTFENIYVAESYQY